MAPIIFDELQVKNILNETARAIDDSKDEPGVARGALMAIELLMKEAEMYQCYEPGNYPVF